VRIPRRIGRQGPEFRRAPGGAQQSRPEYRSAGRHRENGGRSQGERVIRRPRQSRARRTGKAVLSLILAELEADKAEEIVTIDLGGKTDIADAMVVASGRSARHVGAMADKVVKRLKESGMDRARIEGVPACDWVLIDAEDVIVHLFRPEVRQFYNLERIWSETARAPARTDN